MNFAIWEVLEYHKVSDYRSDMRVLRWIVMKKSEIWWYQCNITEQVTIRICSSNSLLLLNNIGIRSSFPPTLIQLLMRRKYNKMILIYKFQLWCKMSKTFVYLSLCRNLYVWSPWLVALSYLDHLTYKDQNALLEVSAGQDMHPEGFHIVS